MFNGQLFRKINESKSLHAEQLRRTLASRKSHMCKRNEMAKRQGERKSLERVTDPNFFRTDYDDSDLYTSFHGVRETSNLKFAKAVKVNKKIVQLEALGGRNSGRRFKAVNIRGHSTTLAAYGNRKADDGNFRSLDHRAVIDRIFNAHTSEGSARFKESSKDQPYGRQKTSYLAMNATLTGARHMRGKSEMTGRIGEPLAPLDNNRQKENRFT